MPEWGRMIIVLTLISAAASFGLAAINRHATPLISENERQFTLRSVVKAIPDSDKPNPCDKAEPKFDNSPDKDAVCIDGHTIYRGRRNGEIVGYAVVSVGEEAYSGTITCLVGLDLQERITGLEVLRHAETPGLGAKIEDCAWRAQMVGKGVDDMVWKVSKDGGDVDQISGATISSRSILYAIEKAQRLLAEKRQQLLEAKPMAENEVCDAR